MPGSQIIGIVTLARVASDCAKVVVVAGGVGSMVVVVARRGTRAILVASPGGTITIGELGRRTIRVDVVSQGENRAGNIIQKLCSCLIIVTPATSDITWPHENRVRRLSQSGLRGRV